MDNNSRRPSRDRTDAVSQGLKATSSLVQSLLTEIYARDIDIASLRSDLTHAKEQIESLRIIIRGGNTTEHSLLTKVALIEKRISEIEEKFEEENKGAGESRSYKVQIIVAIVTGLIGLLSIIINFLLIR